MADFLGRGFNSRPLMAATFFFRAVASDGKIRTGSLSGSDDKAIARELRKQGLTPVYVGVAPKSSRPDGDGGGGTPRTLVGLVKHRAKP